MDVKTPKSLAMEHEELLKELLIEETLLVYSSWEGY